MLQHLNTSAGVFLLFLIYSTLGWCGEMIYCSIGQRKLCEKRGFLNGTLCPIYGFGALWCCGPSGAGAKILSSPFSWAPS